MIEKNPNYHHPVISKNTKVLILGTFPPLGSYFKNNDFFFYASKFNEFWKIMGTVFNTSFDKAKKKDKVAFLKKHKLGLMDIVAEMMRKNKKHSDDTNLNNCKLDDRLESLIKKHQKTLRAVFLTKGIYNLFFNKPNKYADYYKMNERFKGKVIFEKNLPSFSRASYKSKKYTGIGNIKDKIRIYRNVFEKYGVL